jgi:uncharacterized membrane protein
VTRAATAVAAAALVVVVWIVLHLGWYAHDQIVDYGVYQHYGDSIVKRGDAPYLDFQMEYPPAALPVFIVPSWLDRLNFQHVFQTLMALCDIVIVLCVLRLAGKRAAVVAAIAPLLLGSVVVSRFDMWPAALASVALLLAVERRLTISAIFMGTAFAAKLWPAVLVPVLAIWLLRRDGRRAAAEWLLTSVAAAAAWFVPFAVVAPGGVAHSFHEQFARPLQLESLGSAILVAVHHVAGTSVHVVGSFGSQNLAGPGTHAAAVITSLVEAAALVALYVAFARGGASDTEMFRYCAAAVAVTIAFGKVFSPQFLMWLIPFVPLVRGRRGVAASALFLLACVLTQLWFPARYWEYAQEFAPTQSWEVLARDLSVVALAGVLLWPGLRDDPVGAQRERIEALQRVQTQVD